MRHLRPWTMHASADWSISGLCRPPNTRILCSPPHGGAKGALIFYFTCLITYRKKFFFQAPSGPPPLPISIILMPMPPWSEATRWNDPMGGRKSGSGAIQKAPCPRQKTLESSRTAQVSNWTSRVVAQSTRGWQRVKMMKIQGNPQEMREATLWRYQTTLHV